MRGIVLTGATSMLGIALINECIRSHTRVLAIVRENSPNLSRIPQSDLVEKMQCNLSSLDSLDLESNGYDAFFHFGWQGTDRTQRLDPEIQLENVEYTLKAVDLAAKWGCRVFVGAGSQAEYGRVSAKIGPETPVNPDIAYGIAKYAAYKMSAIAAEKQGLAHVWVRVLSVYGPYDGAHTMIMSAVTQLLAKQRPQLTKCEQLWDYLYVEDAARAFYLMGEKAQGQAVYCLGSGVARPLSEYVTILRDTIDPNLGLDFGALAYQPNQVMFLCADLRNLTNDTGFIPEINFETGIEKTIKWVRENENR